MNRVGSILVVAAWLAFLVSLMLPAVQLNTAEPYMGWLVGLAAIARIPDFYSDSTGLLVALAGVGNIFIALSPVALFYPGRRLYRFLALFFMGEFLIALSFYFGDYAQGAGYYLWAASFLVVSAGFGLLSRSVPYNNHLQRGAAPPHA
jgi:hypothetical protein